MTDLYEPDEADEPTPSGGYRSYEVYQRERVGETTNLVNPRDLISDDYLADPFAVPGVLRENYPCYRDWVGNRFWITRYDDVTSVFVDDANFETHPLSNAYGNALTGSDLGQHPTVTQAWVELCDASADVVLSRILDDLPSSCDLVRDFAMRLADDLVSVVLDASAAGESILPLIDVIRTGTGWNEPDRHEGLAAIGRARTVIDDQLAARREAPAGDLLTVLGDIDATPDDVIVTLIELDLATLPASLANLWTLLLTHEDQFELVKHEPRLMKFAYLEALRHSPPAATVDRFCRHEVERFGRLLPHGALVHLSAAAANRDPRQFANPHVFDVARKDLCQREPRGQYRADGLPAGIVFGHGKPSPHPAVPKEGVRSRYALVRDIAVAASLSLLERFPAIGLATGAVPTAQLDRLGGVYQCRDLAVELD